MDKLEPVKKEAVKLLVVEDDPDIRFIICEAIEGLIGIVPRHVSSGNEAIPIIQAERPDIIVSDFRMDNGDGASVLAFLQKVESYEPYFIMFSAEVQMNLPVEQIKKFEIIDKTDIGKLIKRLNKIIEYNRN